MNKCVLGLLVTLLGGTLSTVEAGPFKNRGCMGGYGGCHGGYGWGGGCHGGYGWGGGCHGAYYGCHGGCHGGVTYGGMPTTYYTYGAPTTYYTYSGVPTTYYTYDGYRYVYPTASGPINGYRVADQPAATRDDGLAAIRDNGNGREQIGLPGVNGQIRSPATLIVQMPAEARLTIDGYVTRQASPTRIFVTPPLEPNKDFQYTLRAEMLRDGQTQVVTQQVTIRAGQKKEVLLDFSLPASTNNK